MEMQTEALEMRVGVRPTSDLPSVAANALAKGNSSSALRELAALIGLPGDERAGTIDELSRAALRDLGVFDLGREEAAEQLVRRYARQIVDSELRPVDGGAKIVNAVVQIGWDGEGQPLWDKGTSEIYQLAEMYFGYPQPVRNGRLQFIEDGIISAARRLTQA